uniref:Uncharacterized protein n=1 Tax=Knipowitschia caucasica TaxID=637954 RepID=A0AAV2LQC4_KNICA
MNLKNHLQPLRIAVAVALGAEYAPHLSGGERFRSYLPLQPEEASGQGDRAAEESPDKSTVLGERAEEKRG